MKNTLLLLAGLALAPLAVVPLTARAQSGEAGYEAYKNTIKNGEAAAMQDREAAARRSAPVYRPVRTRAQQARARDSRREDRQDRKAHGGTIAFPGGVRYNKRTGEMTNPDGSSAGNLKGKEVKPTRARVGATPANPVRRAASTTAPRPVDPNNSLGKLQEFNRQEEARKKAAAKPAY